MESCNVSCLFYYISCCEGIMKRSRKCLDGDIMCESLGSLSVRFEGNFIFFANPLIQRQIICNFFVLLFDFFFKVLFLLI